MQEEKTSPSKDTSAGGNPIQVSITHSNVRDVLVGPGSNINHYEIGKQPQAHADILLVTATDIETPAVIKNFPGYKEIFINRSTYYDFGIIAGARVCLVQSEMGTAGAGGALQTVSDGISALSPRAIIMVGIAFGFEREGQKSGDILVSQQIMAYEGQKVSELDGQIRRIPRGDRATASTWLLSRCRNGALDWQGAKVHFGLLLSGDKLIDHREFRDQLLSLEPEAIGGEMEGAGLYAAAQRNNKDWIVIKAICDWADGNKAHRKHDLQQRAAENAARFVYHILQKGGFHQ